MDALQREPSMKVAVLAQVQRQMDRGEFETDVEGFLEDLKGETDDDMDLPDLRPDRPLDLN